MRKMRITGYLPAYNLLLMLDILPHNLELAMRQAGMNQSQLAEAVGNPLSSYTKPNRALDTITTEHETTSELHRGETRGFFASGSGDLRLAFRPSLTEQYPDIVVLEQLDLRSSMCGKDMDGAAEADGPAFSSSLLRHLNPVAPEHVF